MKCTKDREKINKENYKAEEGREEKKENYKDSPSNLEVLAI